uniref:Uncharacterized protein n=1 Tax=Arundo donax TaxID=35708 RepID=A0A0A9G3B1_ARUDO
MQLCLSKLDIFPVILICMVLSIPPCIAPYFPGHNLPTSKHSQG